MHSTSARHPARKNAHVMVPLTPNLREQVEKIAALQDRSMASLCRKFIADGIERFDDNPQSLPTNP